MPALFLNASSPRSANVADLRFLFFLLVVSCVKAHKEDPSWS